MDNRDCRNEAKGDGRGIDEEGEEDDPLFDSKRGRRLLEDTRVRSEEGIQTSSCCIGILTMSHRGRRTVLAIKWPARRGQREYKWVQAHRLAY